MTVQRSDTILYRGRRYFTDASPAANRPTPKPGRLNFPEDSPLQACTDRAVVKRRNALRGRLTSLSRGYRGTWHVQDGKLWLVELDIVNVGVGGDLVPGLAYMFPSATGPVLADWFTGEVVCPLGALLQGPSSHAWPAFRVLHFEQGQLVRSERRDNGEGVRQWQRQEQKSREVAEYVRRRKAELAQERQGLGIPKGIPGAQ